MAIVSNELLTTVSITIGTIILKNFRFPNRAGELQQAGAISELVAELGDNYRAYHDFLASELRRVGGRPDPSAYSDGDAYIRAYERGREIVLAEALLRNCRAFRRTGRTLDTFGGSTPVLDPQDNLVALPD